MAVGNSITAGKDGISGIEGNGFRKYLYDDLKAAGVDFAMVGGRGNAPYQGHFQSGAKIEWFISGGSMDIRTALDAYQPNIVLVHLGTNNAGDTPGPYTQDYTSAGKLRRLINDNIAKDPNVRYILLCKIIPKLDANYMEITAIKQFNKEIELMFFNNALSSKVVLVDMYSAISPTRNELPDGIHPVDAGYQKMAAEYSRVIKALIRSDSSAPNPVSVIAAAVTGDPGIRLEWYTPTDVGGGIVNLYELRYKIDEDITAANFESGQVVYLNRPGRNGYSGGKEQRTITEGILPGRTYYFAIRVYDQANNKSSIRKFEAVPVPDELAQPGIAYVDGFDQSDLRGWNAPPSYVAVNGVLKNTDTASAWKSLAILDTVKYTPAAEYARAAVRFALGGAYSELSGTGIAMLLDSDDYRIANGYMIRVRDDISLYTIVGGQVAGSAISSTKASSRPQKGDTLAVVYRNNPTANSFEVQINGTTIGTVQDSQKRYGRAPVLYSGVMLYGSLMNEIDSFSLVIPQLEPYRMTAYGEPSMYGEVDKKLGTPLSIKVTDINGIGVGNVPVDFRVLSGVPAFLSADSVCQSFDGYIYLEAESGLIEAPMVVAKDDNASNGRYIYSKTFGSGKCTVAFWVPCTGSYDMIFRVIAPDDNSNSLFWAIDDTTSINSSRMDFADKPTTWTWATRSRVNGIPLAEGFHKLYIKAREPNTRIDKVLFTRYSGFVPQGAGGNPPKFANITDARGLVSTNVTFGSQAGTVVIEAYSDAVPATSNRVEFPPITVNAGTPASLTALSSLVIQGEAGKLLPQPFRVQVKDRYGNKRRGETVIFQVLQGDGTFNGGNVEKAFTDEEGVAEARLRLGFGNETTAKAYLNDYPELEPLLFTGAAESGTIPYDITRITPADFFNVPVNTRISDSLKVRVRNQRGDPYRGYPVKFEVTRGDGKLNGSFTTVIDTTDADGMAAVSWTIGRKAGVDSHQVQVKVPLNGSPIVFTATARPDPPNELQMVSGNEQSQGAGKTFPAPLRVRIVDQYNNGIAGYRVRFTVVSGYGNFSRKLIGGSRDTTLTTDDGGYAQVFFMAGATPGIEQVKAEGAESTPLPLRNYRIFQLTVTQPLPQTLAVEGGAGQRRTVGMQLDPFAVKVLDPFGKALGAGIRVVFEVKEGNSSFSNAQTAETVTDAAGIARAVMTLGTTAGTHKAIAKLPDYADVPPVEFTAVAEASAPAALIAAQPATGRFSGQAGSGPITLQVLVTDIYGNPRAGQSVAFAVESGAYFQTQSGNLKITQAASDAKGLATVNYFMGQQTGVLNVITATAVKPDGSHLSGSPLRFEGTVLPGTPVVLRKVKEYSQGVPIRRTYPDTLTVELKDIYQNPVPDVEVLFTVRNNFGGNIGGAKQASVASDSRGRAGVLYTMGTRAATYSDTVLVSVPGYSSLQSERILLTALPGDPHRMDAVGDTSWTIKLGSSSPAKSPTVRVTDEYGNPISGRPVTFTVLTAGSTVNGAQSFTTTTLGNGEASAPWLIVSSTPQQHMLSVSSEWNGMPLLNSPRIFRISVTAGDAARIVRVSPTVDRSEAVARSAMPLIVSLQDAYGNAIAGNTVKFTVTFPTSGDRGYFVADGLPVAERRLTTNAQGLAQVTFYPILGTNIVTVTAGDNQPVPPVAFNITGTAAKAAHISLLNPRQMEVTAGESIPVRVEAYRADGSLVDGHPIDFSIVGDEGHLSNNFTSNRKMTVNGVADETWTVGRTTGRVNKLIVSGGTGIVGSPDSILVRILPAAPFADSSRVQITADGGSITTDNDSKALVTVRLADRFGNPVSGRRVRLTADAPTTLLEQPTAETNSLGEAYGWARSTRVGVISVGAVLESDPTFVIRSAQVTVKPGRAAKIAAAGGDARFTVNVGARLKEPLQVEVRDKYDNLVQSRAAEVLFEIRDGGGEFITATGRVNRTAVQVDSSGRASVMYKAGQQTGNCLITATLSDPPVGTSTAFVGTIRTAAVPFSLSKISGDSLRLPVGQPSPTPLVVQVTDRDGLPVWSGSSPAVVFSSLVGQAEFVGGSSATSDESGYAAKTFKLISGGKHTISAQIFGGESITTFTVSALAGAPSLLAPLSPLHQGAVVASVQNNLLKVKVLDKDGNGVEGVPVIFQKLEEPPQRNGAVVGSEPVTTDADGTAAARITLGEKAGEYIFRAVSPVLAGQQVTFTVHARPDAPYYLSKLSGDRQSMTRGRRLVYPVVVRVTDRYQNPVAGVPVNFAPAAGSGTVSATEVITDETGAAPNWWTIGNADVNILYFQKLGLRTWPIGSPSQFEAYGVDNRFPQFVGLKRDTTIVYGRPFLLRLQAVDEDGDPLRFSVTAKPSTAQFDAASAVMTWTPSYNEIGTWTAKFRVEDNRTPAGFAVDSTRITVISKIKIFDWSPFDSYLRIPENGSQQFCVSVTDQNPFSSVSYQWFVDGILQPGSGSCFLLQAAAFSKSLHTLRVVVNDGVSQDEHVWSIKVKVELTSFTANTVPFQGVLLEWQTAGEGGVLGFDVLRSNAEDDDYLKINEALIGSENGRSYSFTDTSAVAGRTYFYRLEECDRNGLRTRSEALKVNVELPKEFKLLQNFPNPFNPETALRFQLPQPVHTRLTIFNLRGQEVRTLVNDRFEAGYHEVKWNGLNAEGLQVGSGVYYCRIKAGDYTSVIKMVLVR